MSRSVGLKVPNQCFKLAAGFQCIITAASGQATLLTIGYLLGRGLAKSGSRDESR